MLLKLTPQRTELEVIRLGMRTVDATTKYISFVSAHLGIIPRGAVKSSGWHRIQRWIDGDPEEQFLANGS